MSFKYYNANALKNRVEDCVIRAISLAEGESWDYTYDKLSNLAQRKGQMLDNVEFVEDYLDNRYPRQKHYAKTIGEFSKEFTKGIYLCTMPRSYYLYYKSVVFMTHLTLAIEECGVVGK